MVTTERMNIFPISIEKLKEIVEKEKNKMLKIAYQEMLDGCLDYPENYIWYTLWLGYGINEGYENKGYMTEAVTAMAKWASLQPNVNIIESEAEENILHLLEY